MPNELTPRFHKFVDRHLKSRGICAKAGHPDGSLFALNTDGSKDTNYIWVRLTESADDNSAAATLLARCRKVIPRYGDNIILEFSVRDGQLEVVEEDPIPTIEAYGKKITNVPAHAWQHTLYEPDAMYMSAFQFLPLLAHPNGPPDLNVYVEKYSYTYSGTEKVWPGGLLDLTAALPSNITEQKAVVIYLDPATNTLGYAEGSSIETILTDFRTQPFTATDLTSITTSAKIRIAGVRMYYGQEKIVLFDFIEDLRQSAGQVGTGGTIAFTASPTDVFDVAGSGTASIALSMDNQAAHSAFMGPTSGGSSTPAFRAINGNDVMLPKNGSPTYLHAEDANTLAHSAGILDPTVTYVTQVDSTHINVAAGKGWIRTSNAANGQLVFFDWPASSNIAIPAGTGGVDSVRYVGVEYNSGTPQVTIRTTFNWNWYSDFPLARVSQDGTTLRILNAYAHAEDTPNLMRRFLRLVFPFQREEPPEGSGGLVISDISGRHLRMSAGNVWFGFNRYILSAVDTSGAGTFDLHYQNGTGGFTHVASQTLWPNTQYDNGSGTLATMTSNKYACLWVYVDISDGSLDMLYGSNQYTSVVLAQAESTPSTLPGHLQAHGQLLGRFIFQKSAASVSLVESVWATKFSGTSVLALDDLSDVTLTSPATNDFLINDTGTWVNKTVAQVKSILALAVADVTNAANTALSNLSSVAVNTTIASDTDNTDDLGTTTSFWRNILSYLLTLKERTAPSTPASGSGYLYATASHVIRWLTSLGQDNVVHHGGYQGLTSYSNASAETAVATFSLKGGTLGSTGVLAIFANGHQWNNAFGSARTVTIRVRIGGVGGQLAFDSGAISVPNNGNMLWWLTTDAVLNGSATAHDWNTVFAYTATFSTTGVAATPLTGHAALNQNLAVDQDLVVTTQWQSASTALNTFMRGAKLFGPYSV